MTEKITVEATIAAPIQRVWQAWNTPGDIKQWNAASDDWHTTKSEVDLRVGGTFLARMEAKDGSMGFDFAGTYTQVVEHQLIESNFGGRVLGLFCFDAKFLARPDFSPDRFAFFLDTLSALRDELRSIGSDLTVLDESPHKAFGTVFASLADHAGPADGQGYVITGLGRRHVDDDMGAVGEVTDRDAGRLGVTEVEMETGSSVDHQAMGREHLVDVGMGLIEIASRHCSDPGSGAGPVHLEIPLSEGCPSGDGP